MKYFLFSDEWKKIIRIPAKISLIFKNKRANNPTIRQIRTIITMLAKRNCKRTQFQQFFLQQKFPIFAYWQASSIFQGNLSVINVNKL
jgi:hypothetical protein